MMCGLLRPTSGKALVDGLDLYKAPAAARARLGYMAQKFSLYGDLSVRQNLTFFAGAYGLDGRARERRRSSAPSPPSISSPISTTNAGALPLGFKQRLALSCAILHEPPVLFLDEPTSGVDPLTRREFWGFINALVARGVTIMVTTHFMDEAEYCDRVALIYRGQCIAIDTPEALQARVATRGESASDARGRLHRPRRSARQGARHERLRSARTAACAASARSSGKRACRSCATPRASSSASCCRSFC